MTRTFWFGTSADGLIYVKNPVLSDGKLNVTKVYNSDKGSWANDNPLLNNIYTVDFFGKTIYAGSVPGLATYEFDFENSIGTVNPSMGDMNKNECDLEITGAGVQKDAYFSIRGLKNAEGVVHQTKTYNWQNAVGTTGTTEVGRCLHGKSSEGCCRSEGKRLPQLSSFPRTAEQLNCRWINS